ncbi:hypothetical protein CFC21_026640, partial [Triticum aestivum]
EVDPSCIASVSRPFIADGEGDGEAAASPSTTRD